MIGRAVRTAQHRLVEWKRPGANTDTAMLEFYDYEADPNETKNLVADEPGVVAELRAILAQQPEAKPQLGEGKPAKKAGAKKRALKGQFQSSLRDDQQGVTLPKQ
jgi:hypothetical protein